MPNKLTSSEVREIARRRALAKARALRIADTITDEEDAALARAAKSDPDNPPLRSDAQLRPAHEVISGVVAEQLRRRGRPKLDNPKQQVTLRLDPDVIQALRASGRQWQTRVNAILRQSLEPQSGSKKKRPAPRARKQARHP